MTLPGEIHATAVKEFARLGDRELFGHMHEVAQTLLRTDRAAVVIDVDADLSRVDLRAVLPSSSVRSNARLVLIRCIVVVWDLASTTSPEHESLSLLLCLNGSSRLSGAIAPITQGELCHLGIIPRSQLDTNTLTSWDINTFVRMVMVRGIFWVLACVELRWSSWVIGADFESTRARWTKRGAACTHLRPQASTTGDLRRCSRRICPCRRS